MIVNSKILLSILNFIVAFPITYFGIYPYISIYITTCLMLFSLAVQGWVIIMIMKDIKKFELVSIHIIALFLSICILFIHITSVISIAKYGWLKCATCP